MKLPPQRSIQFWTLTQISNLANTDSRVNSWSSASYSVGGAGLSHQYINDKNGCEVDDNGDLCESWGMAAGLGFGINETTSINIFGGYEKDLSAWDVEDVYYGNAWNLGGNIIWQPVKQMKMGWEINYGEAEEKDDGITNTVDSLQLMWGTWFYF